MKLRNSRKGRSLKIIEFTSKGIKFSTNESVRIGYEEYYEYGTTRIYLHPLLSLPPSCPNLYSDDFSKSIKLQLIQQFRNEITMRMDKLLLTAAKEMAGYVLQDKDDASYQTRMDELKQEMQALKTANELLHNMESFYLSG
ncbi:MAG: hypothetical protein QXP70_04835, partial [Methanomassiliicoccales archaeon]